MLEEGEVTVVWGPLTSEGGTFRQLGCLLGSETCGDRRKKAPNSQHPHVVSIAALQIQVRGGQAGRELGTRIPVLAFPTSVCRPLLLGRIHAQSTLGGVARLDWGKELVFS